MSLHKLLISLLLVGSTISSCSEEKIAPISEDGAVPPPVADYTVENIPGGAQIAYRIAPGSGTLYVEAEWELHDGTILTAKSSYFDNTLLVEGFGDTSTYTLKLYAVGRNLKRSDPVNVEIKPKKPSIWDVYSSLDVVEDFGGMTLSFNNMDEEEVSIIVHKQDASGDWIPVEVFYTSRKEGQLAVRGLPPEEARFGIQVKDRWGNLSEMLVRDLTPLYEEKLNKDNFQPHILPTDAPKYNQSVLTNLWSDNIEGYGAGTTGWYRTANGSGMPQHFTFDLGVKAKLGRYQLWQRGVVSQKSLLYAGGSPRVWEVWGSNDPDPMGGDGGWVKLLDCEMTKPSGRPLGNNTLEDEEVALAGHEFKFPLDAPPVRYLRFRIIETWGGTDYMWISELTFFGQPE